MALLPQCPPLSSGHRTCRGSSVALGKDLDQACTQEVPASTGVTVGCRLSPGLSFAEPSEDVAQGGHGHHAVGMGGSIILQLLKNMPERNSML